MRPPVRQTRVKRTALEEPILRRTSVGFQSHRKYGAPLRPPARIRRMETRTEPS
jgi:hypothetical protein